MSSRTLPSGLKPGMRVAVGIGSRGIANLFEIVTAVLNRIRASGAEHESVIRETTKFILGKIPVLFAVAILEDQHHQTHDVRVVRGDEILKVEDALFAKSREMLPDCPFPRLTFSSSMRLARR